MMADFHLITKMQKKFLLKQLKISTMFRMDQVNIIKKCIWCILFQNLVEKGDCKLVQENGESRRIYVGTSNTSIDGPCLKWTNVEHEFVNSPGIGDHNYCRNPDNGKFKQEICFTDNGTSPCDVQTCGEGLKQIFLQYNKCILLSSCYNNCIFQ